MVRSSSTTEKDRTSTHSTSSTSSPPLPLQVAPDPPVSVPTATNESEARRRDTNPRDRPTQIAIPSWQPSVLQGLGGTTHQLSHSPTSFQPSPTSFTNDLPTWEKPSSNHPSGPQRNRPLASQTFAEGMADSLQSLRRKTFDRIQPRRDTR